MKYNILYPGAFKPVHDGHIRLAVSAAAYVRMKTGSTMRDVHVYFIVSEKTRNGITSESSVDFLNSVPFRDYGVIAHVISCGGSPIKKAFDMTAMDECGGDVYFMLGSTKDDDQKRCQLYYDGFQKGGKYYAPGVVVDFINPDVLKPLLYFHRNDSYNGEIISGTIARHDIKTGDFDNFKTNYPWLVTTHEWAVKKYFDVLRSEYAEPIKESGAAGHINHPYEDSGLTFGEIKDMIRDMFLGKITDITEKVDGMNIFASVDESGRTIFARNKSQLFDQHLTIDDLKSNLAWDDNIRSAFVLAAETITSVFNNIKDKESFFIYDDKADRVFYRKWCNFEIVCDSARNVVPYVENIIVFNGFKVSVVDYNIDVNPKSKKDVIDNPNEEDTYKVYDAMKLTDSKNFKVKEPLRVMIRTSEDAANKLIGKYIDLIDGIIDEYKLSDESTILDYKREAFWRILLKSDIVGRIERGELAKLCSRCVDKSSVQLRDFKEPFDRERVKKFEEKELYSATKSVMRPLDKLFMDFGNDVIKVCTNLQNESSKEQTIEKIKDTVKKAIDEIEKSKDQKKIKRFENLMSYIDNNPDINYTEGLVYRRNGRTYKITGTFSVLNQIVNLTRK